MPPSGIPATEGSDAATITSEIFRMFELNNVDTTTIVGLVFDTTNTNSGWIRGIAVQVEERLGRPLMRLACRHHVAELICGAACKEVFGETESPNEPCFVAFCKEWESLDKTSFRVPPITGRFLAGQRDEVRSYLETFLTNPDTNIVRSDYREFALLALLFVGGKTPDGFKLYAPGAYHHARWMAKVIYVLKIVLFRDQLGEIFEEDALDLMRDLAIFLVLFYVRYWFTCPSAVNAPQLDLEMLQLLEKAKTQKDMKEFADASYTRLGCHLWYLTERLVLLALFGSASDADKKQIANKLASYSPAVAEVQIFPEATNYQQKRLKDFVGPDSWTFFKALDVEPTFLKEPVATWANNPVFMKLKALAEPISVTNDCAERALGMLTDYSIDRVTRDEDQKQWLLQVVKEVRKRQGDLIETQSSERCSKRVLKKMKYT